MKQSLEITVHLSRARSDKKRGRIIEWMFCGNIAYAPIASVST